jgi:hypothetical protein
LSGAADDGIASHAASVWQQHQCYIDLADAPFKRTFVEPFGSSANVCRK